MAAYRRSTTCGNVMAAVCLLAAAVAGSVHFQPVRDAARPLTWLFGRESVVACLAGLAVLGAAYRAERRTISNASLHLATGLAFAVLALLTSGWLMLRLLMPQVYGNRPDRDGILQQTTGMTCSPAAAAMLLHRFGISISEGELAERAGTGLLGTDPHSMVRALNRIVGSRGKRARVGRMGYEAAHRLHCPFVAHAFRPSIGGHAVFVETLSRTAATVVDPLLGTQEVEVRESFEEEWNGVTLWIETAVPQTRR
jgi:hypothetical protein